MRLMFFSVAAALAMLPACAMAQTVSFNAGATTDYIARGSTQTNHQSSYSVGAEVDAKGFYLGGWTANVDFGDGTSQEIDTTAGYRTTFHDWNIETGVAAYNYKGDPGRGLDMEEAHVTVGRTFNKVNTSFTVAYSPNYFNLGSRSVWYETKLSTSLTDKLTLGGSVGYQTIDRKEIFPPYFTYNVGLDYALTSKVSVGARYTTNNIPASFGYIADDTVSLSVSTAF